MNMPIGATYYKLVDRLVDDILSDCSNYEGQFNAYLLQEKHKATMALWDEQRKTEKLRLEVMWPLDWPCL